MKTLFILLILLLSSMSSGCGDDNKSNPLSVINHPPVLQTQNDTTVTIGQNLVLQAFATDQDGDGLTYGFKVELSMSDIKLGHIPDVQMDAQTGRMVFVPAEYDIPDRSFDFIVNDGRGGEDTETFKVIVTSQSVH